MSSQPNLLLTLTDQQSATMMSCAGNPHVCSPGMNWITSEGVRFEHAYCTSPVCVPSRFSLMTGRYPIAISQRHSSVKGADAEAAEASYPARAGLVAPGGRV